ncbi:MAG: phosphoadenosine phosphosulfate reductase family protein [Ruminococcus sp.]|nr:phosphoadenosine phosphosulfate reductase family protein [Ruminococcus sp.]
MYNYIWDIKTRGYKLTNQASRFVANEIRPVFVQELLLTGLSERFEFNKNETRPVMWAQKNAYIVVEKGEDGKAVGRKIAQLNRTQYGKPLNPEFFFEGNYKLKPIDIDKMIKANANMMDIIVADTKRRTKELYDADMQRCDIAYIAFSGGKDSIALLDICNRVLPLSVPIIFSDTDMELPDTYDVWDAIKKIYPDREFITAKANVAALDNWRTFAPPSRAIRWCCSVHKSTPALMLLKEKLHKSSIKAMAFVGVRGDESISRSLYEDSAENGVKNASQLNRMPILDWGSHELWLYIFANNLIINEAYKKGLTRVGCMMCPESSEKYVWFVDKAYPNSLKPYNDIIIETSNKKFKNQTDKDEYIGGLSWQARKSGVVLKDSLAMPMPIHNGLDVSFQSTQLNKKYFYEWIKTVGKVVIDKETGQEKIKLPNSLDDGLPFEAIIPDTGEGKLCFHFRDVNEQWLVLPMIRNVIKKSISCVACRSCEAECSVGAIYMNDSEIKIDEEKCVNCHKCYDEGNGSACWRYMSMQVPEKSKSPIVSINNYRNFGLREGDKETWVTLLTEMRDDFFSWNESHPLGEPKVRSARIWFEQAGLISPDNRKLTPLVDFFSRFGGENEIGWEFIWISLANYADIVGWFISATEIDRTYTIKELAEMLGNDKPSLGKSTIDGGLAALKDMLTKSPLGVNGNVTYIEMKGKQIKNLMRKAKSINPISILYSLYVIAHKTNRNGFTVRELMSANDPSTYISPMVAFGISAETFKKECDGLRSRYPDYIETTFTHGNDELTIFPSKYKVEDIIKLAIGE